MEKSEKVPEPKLFSATNKSENSLGLLTPAVTVNQTFYVNPQHDRLTTSCCMDAGYFCQKTPCRVAQVNREFNPPAHAAKHAGLMWYSEPEGGAATPARMDLSPECRCPHPAQSSGDDTRGECNCWKCGRHKCGSTGPANRSAAREEDEYNSQLQSLEEDLEPPLPLRSDDEWQYDSPFVPPHVYMHPHNIHHAMDVRCYHSAGEGHYNFNPVNRYPPQSFHYSAPSQNWLQCHHNCMNGSLSQGGVSVNVPQFSVPPAEGMSQVSVMNLNSAGAEASFSHPHEKIKTISLPDVCRNVFITYSSDASSEIVPFVDFLTKQGFRTAIDIFDSPVRCMDINKWNDSHLKDPSTLIIIAISPKYKADIEGSVEDSHGLHTRYIHTMMQNEFIQQGSLNFRFIPVLFLRSSQKHVPSWLQNSRFYRWPQDTEDLLLRLLREERYVPPPVPMELTLIIRPVDPSCAASL